MAVRKLSARLRGLSYRYVLTPSLICLAHCIVPPFLTPGTLLQRLCALPSPFTRCELAQRIHPCCQRPLVILESTQISYRYVKLRRRSLSRTGGMPVTLENSMKSTVAHWGLGTQLTLYNYWTGFLPADMPSMRLACCPKHIVSSYMLGQRIQKCV